MLKENSTSNNQTFISNELEEIFSPKPNLLTPELKELIDDLYARIKRTYLADGRPWVIGYSGGKDSTVTLQSVWHALNELPKEKLNKPIYVISSDTFVESPPIVNHIKKSIDDINNSARVDKLPFQAHIVQPSIKETFWVNMIGKGYPAPYNRFRWCTDRLKIEPANKFITDAVAKYGEVLVVLGVRKDESSNRAGSMNKRKMIGEQLTRHEELPNAFVFSPIEDWYTDEVWRYLLTTSSPWGGNNHELAALYKNGQDGECPLVIDKDQPSCGNSRFGCWVCTVVQRDKSMEAMITNGEEWMRPLLDFRNWLVETQDPEQKYKIRDWRRRTGKVQYREVNGEKKIIWGPFKFEVRQQILQKLLEAEKSIQENGPNKEERLITDQELLQIRHMWRFEEGDWLDSLPKIYNKITGKILETTKDDWSGMGDLEFETLASVSEEHNLPINLLTELFDAEKRQNGMSRRSNIYNNIDSIFKKDWRPQEEVFMEFGIKGTL
jgi:DNA sulfur modification protein DndC